MQSKKDILMRTLLSDSDLDQVLTTKPTSLNEKQINEVIYSINLCESVSRKYPKCSNGLEIAVRGMRFGLHKYKSSQLDKDDSVNMYAYLTWFMKTAIEFELERDNEDTRAWAEM